MALCVLCGGVYVGALLGVWGIIVLVLPSHERNHGLFKTCLLLVVGVLCENCIVDASIPKHGAFGHCCLGCVISYILCVLCSSRQHDGQLC